MMEVQWDLLESLDEMAYVVDMDTREVIFINANLRDALGFQSKQDYQGRSCCELFHRTCSTCGLCTSDTWKPNCIQTKHPIFSYGNHHYMIKDGFILRNGKRYLLEVAICLDQVIPPSDTTSSHGDETLICSCLQSIFSTTSAQEGLERLLSFIGEHFSCDRVYIFEMNSINGVDNTYEWCAPGVIPQKELLQNEPFETVQWWFELFDENEMVIIDDVETIRMEQPLVYAMLKPQNIHSMIAGPIRSEHDITGFLGVDNPDPSKLSILHSLFQALGYFVSSLLKQRDLLCRLNELSVHDPLTGVYNRNALSDFYTIDMSLSCIGIIYCNISGIKYINDTLGHAAGDTLILHCCRLIQNVVSYGDVYRIGGDEFIVICPNIPEDILLDKVQKLKYAITQEDNHIAVGYTWSDQHPMLIQKLISLADKVMCEDKQDYYLNHSIVQTLQTAHQKAHPNGHPNNTSAFWNYLHNNYYNPETIFRSITLSDTFHFIFFGDLKTNHYYISDNLRDTFGFSDNTISFFPTEWEKRIATEAHRALFRQDIAQIMQEHRTTHDLRYQVQDVEGRTYWVHSCGIIEWNDDHNVPRFFSGSITAQNDAFTVDPVTNFFGEYAALTKLMELQEQEQESILIVFSLDSFTEINQTKGRYLGNLLLQAISSRLTRHFTFPFYRLDGVRFMTILPVNDFEYCQQCIEDIRTVIEQEYHINEIPVHHPCSFGLLSFPNEVDTAQSIIEHAILLISAAKESIDEPYLIYSPYHVEQLKYTAELSLALNQDVFEGMRHFRIVIQPIVDIKSGMPVGGEVLLRWRYQGKDISPGTFVPLLEKGNAIRPVGKWVFEQTVRSVGRLISYMPDMFLSFNVSYFQIMDNEFTEFMSETLEKYGVDGSHLVAELTETHYKEDPHMLQYFVSECSVLGIRVALDDFGNGYSSLGLLLKYPSSIIKLDRTLLVEMSDSEEKKNFISSIVYACHKFGKRVCMEGVETFDEHMMIEESGCDLVQGHFHFPPMETYELYHLLSQMPSDENN